MTSTITQYQQQNSEDRKRKQALRTLHEEDVVLLEQLTAELFRRLREEVHAPTLVVHPLFKQLSALATTSVFSLCHVAMKETSLLTRENANTLDKILLTWGADDDAIKWNAFSAWKRAAKFGKRARRRRGWRVFKTLLRCRCRCWTRQAGRSELSPRTPSSA